MWISKKEWADLLDELNEFRKELEKYKQLYLDELQKRLELAEMVRKMDGD